MKIKTLAVTVLLAAAPASSQTLYVCQTQFFWCTFQWSQGVPDGYPCYCHSQMGPVNGYSILPPQFQPDFVENLEPSEDIYESDPEACFRGLGECEGDFGFSLEPTVPWEDDCGGLDCESDLE
jgi:hypothetical protein